LFVIVQQHVDVMLIVFVFAQAEDAYPVDEENQGNTLVSVAPLNLLETREKPANGDSQEAAKTQPPPTNGHSTANLADTEL
jgi:hypothetical protein